MTLGRPVGQHGANNPAAAIPTSKAPGGAGAAGNVPPHHAAVNKFLQPLRTCDLFINDLIEDLEPDPWPVPQGQRHVRATGTALSVAITLLEVIFGVHAPISKFRIMGKMGLK